MQGGVGELFFFFSSRRRHTRCSRDWSSDVCSSDLEEAAEGWRQILELRRCPQAILREATEALAVHHEHRARDLQVARAFALQSLSFTATRSRQEATQHRLSRLNRKIDGNGLVPAQLF